MNFKAISRNVGYALLVSALFMFLSVGVSLLNGHDSGLAALLVSSLITFIVGIFPFIFVSGTDALTLKDGYLTIVLSWLLSFIFGMLPYALWGGPFTLANAWFESVSGYTTTGATVLSDIEALPKSLLFWRSSTHFIGGLGVVVFLLLIIPNASPVKTRLTSMELSSLSRSGYTTRTNQTVYIFAYVYLALTVLAFGSYLLCGMPAFDALCHAFSVCATGGFSTRNLSIAAFDSRPVELVTMIFMYLSSIHFGILYVAVVKRTLKPFNNPVLKFYTASLIVFSLVSGISLRMRGMEHSFGRALWYGTFQTLSTASTTGFAIIDNASWPLFTSILLLFTGVMCGCAGSTTCGVKADRVLLLLKAIGLQIDKILHPASINEVKMGSKVLAAEEASPHILYIALYSFLLAISVVLSLMFGVSGHSSFAASVSSLSNVGPAIQELGYLGNYSGVPLAAKLLYTFDMFLGRVEIFPILAVVAMVFDRKKK
ncbi:MAG: TrkH family potassium uptake protein [Bacteroidales bacterium]|nr:TrkH family potassium uptake protein [Bacteroidales bacterium]